MAATGKVRTAGLWGRARRTGGPDAERWEDLPFASRAVSGGTRRPTRPGQLALEIVQSLSKLALTLEAVDQLRAVGLVQDQDELSGSAPPGFHSQMLAATMKKPDHQRDFRRIRRRAVGEATKGDTLSCPL